jgi:hypothetical protein
MSFAEVVNGRCHCHNLYMLLGFWREGEVWGVIALEVREAG